MHADVHLARQWRGWALQLHGGSTAQPTVVDGVSGAAGSRVDAASIAVEAAGQGQRHGQMGLVTVWHCWARRDGGFAVDVVSRWPACNPSGSPADDVEVRHHWAVGAASRALNNGCSRWGGKRHTRQPSQHSPPQPAQRCTHRHGHQALTRWQTGWLPCWPPRLCSRPRSASPPRQGGRSSAPGRYPWWQCTCLVAVVRRT